MRQNYRDRMMKARDPRYAKIASALGYNRRDMVADQADELADLRAQYTDLVGKRPFMGWDADTLREKIAAAKKDAK